LGTVEIVDCLPMVRGRLIADSDEFPIDDPRLGTQERAFGHYAPGPDGLAMDFDLGGPGKPKR
jgi:hypothetical protein